MSLLIELKLIKNKNLEQLEFDLRILLIHFKTLNLIKTAPRMDLIAYYTDPNIDNKIFLDFTQFNFKPTDDQKNQFDCFFRILIKDILIKLKILQDYDIISLKSHPKSIKISDSIFKSIAISVGDEANQKNIPTFKSSFGNDRIQKGFFITLCRKISRESYPSFKLASDSEMLVKRLNEDPIKIHLTDILLIAKPVILLEINRQSFTLVIPDIFPTSEKDVDFTLNCFLERFKHFGVLNDYIISKYGTTANIKEPNFLDNITQNTVILEAIGDLNVPTSYICAFTDQIMDEPIILPKSTIYVDKKLFLLSYINSPENPFTREMIANPLIIPVDIKLKQEIRLYVLKQIMNYFSLHKPKNLTICLSLSQVSSPISAKGDAHEKLLRQISNIILKNKPNFDTFLESIDAKKYSQALRRACTVKHPDAIVLIKILLSYKEILQIDINEQAGDKQLSALHIAALKGNQEIYLNLKTNGAIDLKDSDGTFASTHMEKHLKEKNSINGITKP